MSRKIALLFTVLCVGASSHAVERGGSEPPEPDTAEVSAAEEAPQASSHRPVLTLSPLNRSIKGLQSSTAADGTMKVDLDGRFQHTLVLRVAPDGSRSIECIDSAEEEAELLGLEIMPAAEGSDDGNEN